MRCICIKDHLTTNISMDNLIEFQKATREEVCIVGSKRGFLIQPDP